MGRHMRVGIGSAIIGVLFGFLITGSYFVRHSVPPPIPFVPLIIQRSLPEMEVNVAIIGQAKCRRTAYDRTASLDCQNDSPLHALGCDRIDGGNPLWSGIQSDNAEVVAMCIRYHRQQGGGIDPSIAGMFTGGCLLITSLSYIVYHNGSFEMVEHTEDFIALFAPVETPAEALGFVEVLQNDVFLDSDIEYDPNMTYRVPVIETSHVRETTDGFRINAFAGVGGCRCDDRRRDQVNMLVRRDGSISAMSRHVLWTGFVNCVI